MTKKMRAGGPGRKARRSPTASKAGATRKAADSVRRNRRPVFETWGTIQRPEDMRAGALPSVCLWGTQTDAMLGCDPDEHVCLVRVEVLEVLDE